MKKLATLLLLSSVTVFGQIKTTVSDGNFFAFATWDCFCLPASGDTLIINHELTMNTGIAYNSGKITISSLGRLTDGGTDKDIFVNGGEFYNYGTLECDAFWLESGYLFNAGDILLDSLWTRDTVDNQGPITTFDFLNDQDAKFTSTRDITVQNNFANQGHMAMSGANMSVGNNFSNCNISSSDALFSLQNGILCVDNDFLNCGTDTLRGNGEIYITGASTNGGEVEGTLNINTSSGGFSFNTGNVESTVTFGTGTCHLGQEELNNLKFNAFPNPSNGTITLSELNVNYTLFDLAGKVLDTGLSKNGQLDFTHVNAGVYLLQLRKDKAVQTLKITIK